VPESPPQSCALVHTQLRRRSRSVQTSARIVMLTRVSGIIAGVTITLLLSVTLLPTAAHHVIDKQLAAALRELLTLHGLCWLPMADTAVLDPQRRQQNCDSHTDGTDTGEVRVTPLARAVRSSSSPYADIVMWCGSFAVGSGFAQGVNVLYMHSYGDLSVLMRSYGDLFVISRESTMHVEPGRASQHCLCTLQCSAQMHDGPDMLSRGRQLQWCDGVGGHPTLSFWPT
jgi:hypothetical protein